MHLFKHFITITRHRHMVMINCFRAGLYRQGLLHDLSKYGFCEFFNGIKYYAGFKSPHHNERDDKGYSEAWMHHKGRNKHHSEYWFDMNMKTKQYEACLMPDRYIAEMVCDRIAASKNYNRGHYNRSMPLDYYYFEGDKTIMHPSVRKKLVFLLEMYRDYGEKYTFRYLKKNMRHNYFTEIEV